MATVAAEVVLNEVLKPDFLQNVRENGNYLVKRLKEFNFKVKGIGLMIGMDLPESINASEVVKKALEKGLILGTAGENTLRFVPPLIITKKEIDEGVEILREILK